MPEMQYLPKYIKVLHRFHESMFSKLERNAKCARGSFLYLFLIVIRILCKEKLWVFFSKKKTLNFKTTFFLISMFAVREQK